jgi:glycosyltransferase involved in cell wall biosynthesis
MRILVYPHSLEIGGGQVNALNLAGAMRDRGHDVLVFGPPGPLERTASELGLRLVRQALPGGGRPSLRAAGMVRAVAREEAVDVVHAYSHSASIEAWMGSYVLGGIPVVGTVAEVLPRPFPPSIRLIVRIQRLEDEARRSGYPNPVHLQRTPVDTEGNRPGVDGSHFRRAHGLDDGRRNIVLVSRLATYMKLEGLKRAIDAAAILAETMPVRLIVVGGGPRYDELRRRAAAVNDRLGNRVIVLTGPMLDPRPAYEVADVVMGIAGSVLRGMAFQKPAIVLGERGFSEVVTPETVGRFLREGFFGLGNGDPGPERLREQLGRLLEDPPLAKRLGRFSREVICEQFSLSAAAAALERIYESALDGGTSPVRRFGEGLRFLGSVAAGRVRRLVR